MRNIIYILALFSIVSCRNRQQKVPQTPATAVSPTLDKPNESDDFFSSEISLREYSRKESENLVDRLYKDLVQKTPTLQQLERKMDSFRTIKPTQINVFSDFDERSVDYYQAAETKGRSLQDSLLRKEVQTWLEKSLNAYKNQTTAWTDLLAQLNTKNIRLNDYYNLLKIHLTLPLIEDFQKKRLPPTKEIQQLLLQQAALQQQIDSLMKKR